MRALGRPGERLHPCLGHRDDGVNLDVILGEVSRLPFRRTVRYGMCSNGLQVDIFVAVETKLLHQRGQLVLHASAVAGPQSGYAWDFELPDYAACAGSPTAAPTAACVIAATDEMGPWQRIRYPGSQIAYDIPGDTRTGLFAGGLDGSNVGFALSPSTPLTATTGQADGTPNAIRQQFPQVTLIASADNLGFAAGNNLALERIGFSQTPGSPANACLLYTSDAADDLLCVELGGRRITQKKKPNIPNYLYLTTHHDT